MSVTVVVIEFSRLMLISQCQAEFVLLFCNFAVLSWKCPGIFFAKSVWTPCSQTIQSLEWR